MKNLQAYQTARQTSTPRIEMVLTWFEQVLDRLNKCQQLPEDARRSQWLTEARLLIGGLMGGLNPADPLQANFFRLYEYVLHLLGEPTPTRLAEAQTLLVSLQETFVAVREQALALERDGGLPSLAAAGSVSAVA